VHRDVPFLVCIPIFHSLFHSIYRFHKRIFVFKYGLCYLFSHKVGGRDLAALQHVPHFGTTEIHDFFTTPFLRLFNLFWSSMINESWQRRSTTENTENTERYCFLCVLRALCGYKPFQKIIKSLPFFNSHTPLSLSFCPGARPDLLRTLLWCGGWK